MIRLVIFVVWSALILITSACKKKESATLATVETIPPYGITQTSAISGGIISDDGCAEISARGVCWSTTGNPGLPGMETSDGKGSGTFTSLVTALIPNQTYYLRAYAINSAGTAYGNEIVFRTLSDQNLPTVTTAMVTEITPSTAMCGGEVVSDNGSAVTSRGVCWSTGSSPTVLDQKSINGAGTGAFISSITGLTANTPYFVRAYATNGAGTAYGNAVSFLREFPDTIVYTALNPPVTISSVQRMDPPTLLYDCYQPYPYNSSNAYAVDADIDGTPDIKVVIANWFEFVSASNPCNNFNYYSDLRAIRNEDSVAVKGYGICARKFNAGDPVDSSLNYNKSGETLRAYWMAMPCGENPEVSGNYYGFKIKKGNGFMYGWIRLIFTWETHSVTIAEFAVNKTVNKKILAGQTN